MTLALLAGWLGMGRWELVLKALNPTPFGIRDPLFDQEVAAGGGRGAAESIGGSRGLGEGAA
jgi:hypothetical protein